MDSKRKANAVASSGTGDRLSKRRRVDEFNLDKGETRESTTAYGLGFLEQIRRTADKNGRLIAGYFEKLVPREGNGDYYRRIRMPISLEIIEAKLEKQEFRNLAELESYCKRMIANAKEFYPRNSLTFEDAERVRKALSNYMTRNNPAYHDRSYQALPTPLPPEDGQEDPDESDGDEGKGGRAAVNHRQGTAESEAAVAGREEQEAEELDGDEMASKRKSIILRRTGNTRPTKNSGADNQDRPKPLPLPSRPDHQYEGVPYEGLSFQQAQEKVVEELLRHKEPEYEGYFAPFVNLPPRSLKDYYRLITEPLSLKKLQKMVKGIYGRNNSGNTTEFKTWSAFEERAKMLWENAYFYNEEGSEIYHLAQDLEKAFKVQYKQAQAHVPEPAQPKIKIRVGHNADTPSSSKKITIHVGGRGGSVESPAPRTSRASEVADSPVTQAAGDGRATSPAPVQPLVDPQGHARSASAVSPSPSASAAIKGEGGAQLSPAGVARPPSSTPDQLIPAAARPPIPAIPSLLYQNSTPMNGIVEPKKIRRTGKGVKDALITRLRIQTHPAVQVDRPFMVQVDPHPTEMEQSATVTVPATHSRVCVVPMLPDFLQDRQYSVWTLIDMQPLKPSPMPIPNQLPQERVFEVLLRQGLNVIETHVVAAIPRNEREPGGPEVEVEVFSVYVNVARN